MTLTQSFQVLLVYQAIRHYGSELAGQAVAHQKYLTLLRIPTIGSLEYRHRLVGDGRFAVFACC